MFQDVDHGKLLADSGSAVDLSVQTGTFLLFTPKHYTRKCSNTLVSLHWCKSCGHIVCDVNSVAVALMLNIGVPFTGFSLTPEIGQFDPQSCPFGLLTSTDKVSISSSS